MINYAKRGLRVVALAALVGTFGMAGPAHQAAADPIEIRIMDGPLSVLGGPRLEMVTFKEPCMCRFLNLERRVGAAAGAAIFRPTPIAGSVLGWMVADLFHDARHIRTELLPPVGSGVLLRSNVVE